MDQIYKLLQSADVIFWDFDGVIKDSVTVKSAAFEHLFLPYGKAIAAQVRQHHEAHGGISRYEKMPIYLGWVGESVDELTVQKFCDRFSKLVQQAVIDSPWVPGIKPYLEANHTRQRFILVTATPQSEIIRILTALNLRDCFEQVYGAPKPKSQAVMKYLQQWQYRPDQAVLVGDSQSDLVAAQTNYVPFLLRSTPLNRSLQKTYAGPKFKELICG
ncbi:MAG: HAD hydrolase-like protein [Cyanobacteria bacterium P01_A01_bin.123]